MNLTSVFRKGQQGANKGLDTGIKSLNDALNGVQRKAIYGLAAAPKVGKSTLMDYSFILSPYLNNPDEDIHWKYFSFEIDRVKKEFKFAAFFFNYDYGINSFQHPQSYRGSNTLEMSDSYLMGKQQDDDGNLIKILPEHEELLMIIYQNRIIPLFGEFDDEGKKIRDGKMDFIEEKDNPTGLRNYLLNFAKTRGEFIFEKYETIDQATKAKVERERIVGYKPKEEFKDSYVIIMTDHIRKLRYERGYTLKQNIDKWIAYQVELRNWCGFTFVNISHLNRSMSDIQRAKYLGEMLYPNGDDIKDSGNLSEEADYVITMMNPNDEKYNLTSHFGTVIKDSEKVILYPNYKSIHLVESRDTECPIHTKTIMEGNINNFKPFPETLYTTNF